MARFTSLAWVIGLAALVVIASLILFGRPDDVHEAVESAGDLASAAGALVSDDGDPDHDDDEDGDDDTAGNGDDDDDDDGVASRVEVVDGVPMVLLDDEDQVRVGIKTARLTGLSHRPEIIATASVVDMQPLLAHRGQCLGAKYEVDLARTRLVASKREYERLRKLNQDDGNVAAKRVQEADAKVQIDQFAVAQAEAALETLISEARQSWGPTVAEWLIEELDPTLTRLIDGDDAMLLIVLPRGETLPPQGADAWVSTLQNGASQRAAQFVSRAPYTDPVAQGESYFYRTEAEGLRAGMRAQARLATAVAPADGVLVPSSAIVWALGDAWAYLAVDDGRFARVPVPTDTELADGWFVTDGLAAGEEIVVTGAQTLYAEEFRWQVFEEDDD